MEQHEKSKIIKKKKKKNQKRTKYQKSTTSKKKEKDVSNFFFINHPETAQPFFYKEMLQEIVQQLSQQIEKKTTKWALDPKGRTPPSGVLLVVCFGFTQLFACLCTCVFFWTFL